MTDLVHHQEAHSKASVTVRDVVLGMADGLTVPFALAAGVAGAVASTRIVVTAAHCLPSLPEGFSVGYIEGRTYRSLLGPLGEQPKVWTECLFVDPVADLAVLGTPDRQALYEHADSFDALTGSIRPLAVNGLSTDQEKKQRAWLLSLNGEWFSCSVEHYGGPW